MAGLAKLAKNTGTTPTKKERVKGVKRETVNKGVEHPVPNIS